MRGHLERNRPQNKVRESSRFLRTEESGLGREGAVHQQSVGRPGRCSAVTPLPLPGRAGHGRRLSGRPPGTASVPGAPRRPAGPPLSLAEAAWFASFGFGSQGTPCAQRLCGSARLPLTQELPALGFVSAGPSAPCPREQTVCHCPVPSQAAPSPRPPAPSEFGLRGWSGSAPSICTHCVGGTVSPSTRHSPSPGWDCVRRQGLSGGDELTEATRVLVRRGDEGPDARSRPHEDAGSRRVSARGASRRRGPPCTPGPPPSAFGATGKVSFKTPLHSEFQRDVVESAIGLFQDVSRIFGCVESFSAVVTSVSKLQAPPHSLFPEQVPHNHACAPNPSAPRRGASGRPCWRGEEGLGERDKGTKRDARGRWRRSRPEVWGPGRDGKNRHRDVQRGRNRGVHFSFSR